MSIRDHRTWRRSAHRSGTSPLATAWGGIEGQRDVWPTPDQDLLLRATLRADDEAGEAWLAVRDRVDVAGLDGATTALLPQLRRNLASRGLDDELLPLFRGVHRHTWARNQLLVHSVLPVVAELERTGIPTMLLKGAAMVADTRLDAGMRAMNDIDVLVPTAMAPAAIDVLLASGFEPVGGVPPWYVADYAPRFVPSHGFRDKDDRQLDLHWHVLHAACQPDADDDFWAAALPLELAGVRTRSLCPADELLLVILHGLRWNEIPTYRWVVDATLLSRGLSGPIDFERLVEQARIRRSVAVLSAGLTYLRRAVGAPIPDTTLRALRARRPSRLERLEFRARLKQPRLRSRFQRELVYHEQFLRRHLPLGERATMRERIRFERRRLGIEEWRDWRYALSGGRPGPGRPHAEIAAAIGNGGAEPGAKPIELGEPIDMRHADLARSYSAYGMWRAEPGGSWIAGREGRLVLPLARPASATLLLEMSFDAFLAPQCRRQRVTVTANGTPVAKICVGIDAGATTTTAVIPREAVEDRSAIELTFSTPDAATPTQLGHEDDDRRVSVQLKQLVLRERVLHAIGTRIALGEHSEGEAVLAGGWSVAEPYGRWTQGRLANLRLWLEQPSTPLDLEFDATPLLGPSAPRLSVEVLVNGRRIGSIAYDQRTARPGSNRFPIPEHAIGADGELVIGWRIRKPRSPHSLGMSDDRRPLGLFMERIRLLPGA